MLLAAALPALVLVLACSGSDKPGPSPTAPATEIATALPPAPAPTATPEPENLGEGSIELIRRGWLSIAGFHISSPDPRPLLTAAWQEAGVEARKHGVTQGTLPELTSDRDQMWDAFSAAYIGLLRATPPDAWDDLRFAAFTGMTKSLNDCHTFFLAPSRSAFIDVHEGKARGGIGVELAAVKPPYVRDIYGGSPAETAGIQLGDVLLAVDGKDVGPLDAIGIDALLRGDPGSQAALQLRRPSTGVVMTVQVTRALVRTPAVEARSLAGGTGYIKIRAFTVGTEVRDAVSKALTAFEAGGDTSWVIDLRDNGGGDSDLVLDGYFTGTEVAERTRLRDGGLEIKDGEGEPFPGRPLAVLVNVNSASVSEIFAAMLQDYGRARVFGTQTAKCAGFVNLDQYPDGSTLAVTIAHSLTPKTERPLWQTGVLPDQVVRQTADDVAANRDPVLDAAVSWLKTQVR